MDRSVLERSRVARRALSAAAVVALVLGTAGTAWAGGNGNGNPGASHRNGDPNSPGNPGASHGNGNGNGNGKPNGSGKPNNSNGKPNNGGNGNGHGNAAASHGASAQAPGHQPGGGRANNNRNPNAGAAGADHGRPRAQAQRQVQVQGQGTSLAPPGSNGHILASTDGCTVNVGFYGFDTGMSDVGVVVTEKPPTGRDTILHTGNWTADYAPRLQGNTLQDTTSFTLSGDHHVKITAYVVGADGHLTRKTKVQWVHCGAPASAGSPSVAATVASVDLRPTVPVVPPRWSAIPAAKAFVAGSVATPAVPGPPAFFTASRLAPVPTVGGVAVANITGSVLAVTTGPAPGPRAYAERARGARVLGSLFEHNTTRQFAFTGADLLTLALLAFAATLFGWRLRRAGDATD